MNRSMNPDYRKHKDFEYNFRYSGRHMGMVVLAGCLVILLLLLVGIAAWTLIIMGAWNFLLAPAFHLGTIDWPQAFAVAVVLSIIQSSIAGSRGRD